MRILLDMDEPIAAFVKRILEYWNEDSGKNLKLNDIKSWELTTYMGKGSEYALRSYMRYTELYRDLEPTKGAVEGTKELIDRGHDVYIVSAVPMSAGTAYFGKLEFLRRNMPYFDLHKFIACQEKGMIKGDLILDDRTKNLEDCKKEGMIAVAFDRPWNQDWNGLRVKTWSSFLSLIDKIEKEKSWKK